MFIRHKLILGSCLAIAVVGILGFIALQAIGATAREMSRASTSSIRELDAAKGMRQSLVRLQASAQELLIQRTTQAPISQQAIEAARAEIRDTAARFERHLQASRRATDSGIRFSTETPTGDDDLAQEQEELRMLEDIESGFTVYRLLSVELLNLPARNSDRALQIVDELERKCEQLNTLLDRYRTAQTNEIRQDSEQALAHVAESRTVLLISLFMALALSLVLAVWNTATILKPINLLTEASDRLAADEPGAVVNYRSTNELGQLAAAFNEMSSRVQQRDRALQEAQILLEERIRERTAALEETNLALRSEREALQESELRFQQMAENVDQVFWMASPDGREIIYISPAYEKIWCRSRASIYTNPASWMDAIVPEDRPSVTAALVGVAAGQTYDIEYRITGSETSLRWIRDRGFPVHDPEGRVIRACGVRDDITARKAAEAELQLAEQRLRDASREAGMAEVAASVLHNVGNVLNSVNVSIGLATEKMNRMKATGLERIAKMLETHAENLPAFFAEHPQGMRLPVFLGQLATHFATEQQTVLRELTSLRTNVEHINEIVAMQQSYATAGGLIEVLPLTEIIQDALRMNAAACERHGTRIVCDLDSMLPPMPVDRNKLLLILVNLIRNAKYACDEGEQPDKCITLRAQLIGQDCAKICVADNGIGIPPENLARVFEHGFTTRKTGHGFGLHNSALAAHDMGGSLSVHSDGPGCGATFTIELPLQRHKL